MCSCLLEREIRRAAAFCPTVDPGNDVLLHPSVALPYWYLIFVNVPDIVFIIHFLDLPLSPSSFQADISITYCLPHANGTVKFVAITLETLIWYQPISVGWICLWYIEYIVSGHPLSAGGLHITLISHVNDSVPSLTITGGDGTSAVDKESFWTTEIKNSVKESFSWKVNDRYRFESLLNL